jgi:hypothetical protein
VAKPENEAARASENEGPGEKPTRLGYRYQTNREQPEYDHQSNWMRRQEPSSVSTEWNDLARVKVGLGLRSLPRMSTRLH